MRLDLIESLRSITGKDHIRTISGHSLSAVREKMTKIEKSVDYLRDFVIGYIKGALERLNEAEEGADYGKAYKEHCTQLVDYLSEHKLLGKTEAFVKASVSKYVIDE